MTTMRERFAKFAETATQPRCRNCGYRIAGAVFETEVGSFVESESEIARAMQPREPCRLDPCIGCGKPGIGIGYCHACRKKQEEAPNLQPREPSVLIQAERNLRNLCALNPYACIVIAAEAKRKGGE